MISRALVDPLRKELAIRQQKAGNSRGNCMKIKGWCRQINNIENCVADSTDPSKVQSERNFLGSTMNMLVSVQEQFLDMMEDSEAKSVAQDKFEMWERKHSDALK